MEFDTCEEEVYILFGRLRTSESEYFFVEKNRERLRLKIH